MWFKDDGGNWYLQERIESGRVEGRSCWKKDEQGNWYLAEMADVHRAVSIPVAESAFYLPENLERTA